MPKGQYIRTDKHRKILIDRNKSAEHINKIKKSLKGHGFSSETLNKMRDNHADFTGNKNPRWKGGSYIDKNGYKFIYSTEHPMKNLKGYVREHLLVLSNHTEVFKSSIIHHIDGNKLNNNISNLMIMNGNAAHRRIHCNKCINGDIIFDGRKYGN